MTDLEWQKLEKTVAQMTPADRERLLALISSSHLRGATSAKDPLLGLMADEPELMDEVVRSAHAARERDPLRLGSDG